MAGNTKLVGFQPRLDDGSGVILLERWGSQENVIISGDSLDSIREACLKLPQAPKQQESVKDGFTAKYNESMGRVDVAVTPQIAETLVLLFKDCIEAGVPIRHDLVGTWICDLEKAVKAHHDYHHKEGEPGVEDTH